MLNLGGRIRELDGIRGLAIALVLIFHYLPDVLNPYAGFLPRILSAAIRLTWSGVDLFFVLSGFLIGGILIDARDSTNYFQLFYTRRFFRIVPIYAAFLLLFLGFSLVAPRFPNMNLGWLVSTPVPWYSYVTFTQNFWTAAMRNMGTSGLAVTWSLAVEEQFYLTLPLAVRLLPRGKLVPFIVSGIVMAPLVRAVVFYSLHQNGAAVYVLMPCRADALLLGVLAAVLMRNAEWREKITKGQLFFRIAFPVLMAGLLAFTKIGSSISSPLLCVVGLTWLAFFYFCILLFVLTRPASLLGGVFRNSVLRWLGTIAYGVYLLHQMMRGVVFSWLGGKYMDGISRFDNLLPMLVALGLTLLIARLSWLYFERPLIQVGHRARYRFTEAEPAGGHAVKSALA